MKFRLLTFCLCIFTALNSSANNYVVVEIHGSAMGFNENTNSWTKLSENDSVSAKGKVRLDQSEYLLLNSKHGILEFNVKGTYDLEAYVGKTIELNEFAANYEKKAIDSLNGLTPKRRKLYSKNLLDAQTENDLLSVYPSATVMLDGEIELVWRPMDDNIYIVEIFYSKNSIYFYREVNGDRIKLNLFELNMPTDRCLYWTVRVKGSKYKSEPKCLYLLNIGEVSEIEVDRYNLENQLNLEQSAIHNLMMALYYEKHQVMYKAENCYEMAWSLARNDNRYKQIYYNFLDRSKKEVID
ncbi:MAG: hypothetical protein JXQ87_07575 [Bacteroidia bacterium]